MKTFAILGTSVLLAAAIAWGAGQGTLAAFGWPLPFLCAALSFAINWIAFLPAWAARTEKYYDLVGSLTYLSLIGCSVALGKPDTRGWLLAGMATIWAMRLGSFLFLRIHKAGKDRRFDEVKQNFGDFLVAWTLQAAWVFLTLCCALTAITTVGGPPLGIWAAVGGSLWLLGFGIEIVADRQKSAFRSKPENQGRFITSGLWAWSRHPNYCGEIILWIGVAILCVPVLSGWQFVTLISPVFVYLLLTKISGVPPLETRAEKKWGDDPMYRAYVERTPVLWLKPPRSS